MKHYFNANKVLSITALAIGAITVFFACKKEDKEADDKRDVQVMNAAQKEAEINAIYEDAVEVSLEYNTKDDLLSARRAGDVTSGDMSRYCPTSDLTISPADATWPKTVTIDFKEGCTDEYNRTRRGKIRIVLNKRIFLQGATATITFEDYYVNDVKVEGQQVLQNLSSTEGFAYTYTVTNGKLTYGDTAVVNYSGTRTLVQKEGQSTPFKLEDDVYELKGTATVSDSLFTAQVAITEGLQRKLNCAHVGKGILTVTVNSLIAKIDYGNGDCDNKALLTVGDKSKVITILP